MSSVKLRAVAFFNAFPFSGSGCRSGLCWLDLAVDRRGAGKSNDRENEMGKGSDSSTVDAAPEVSTRHSSVSLRLPKTEKRCSYRLLTLGNGLKVSLISDPETDKVKGGKGVFGRLID